MLKPWTLGGERVAQLNARSGVDNPRIANFVGIRYVKLIVQISADVATGDVHRERPTIPRQRRRAFPPRRPARSVEVGLTDRIHGWRTWNECTLPLIDVGNGQ